MPLYVDAIGTATHLGDTSDVVMSALRTRLTAFTPLQVRYPSGAVGPVHAVGGAKPLVGAQVFESDIDDRERLLRLSALALSRCAPATRDAKPAQQPLPPLLLCVPLDAVEPYDKARSGVAATKVLDQWAASLLRELADRVQSVFDASRSRIVWGDRTAIAKALTLAATLSTQEGSNRLRVGEPLCYVGACDSLLRLGRLQRLIRDGRVRHSKYQSGVMPGEAAAVLCISARPSDRSLACIAGSSCVESSPPKGGGAWLPGGQLTEACRAALQAARLPIEDVGAFSHDGAGAHGSFEEIAIATSRLRPKRTQTFDRWTITVGLGDTGTAIGALAVGYDAHALRAGWCEGRAVLHLAIGEDGTRGAVCLTTAKIESRK